jgi:HAD superfamily, subfamily IIIB (Acid phosphatase)
MGSLRNRRMIAPVCGTEGRGQRCAWKRRAEPFCATPSHLASTGPLLRAAIIGLSSFAAPTALQAQSCPAERKPNLPALEEPKDNIDRHKRQLRTYENGAYKDDIKLVLDDALAYVMSRADKVERPAVVLDIDETSLSNWDNIAADDFGYIGAGECSMLPKYPCGFPAWINRAEARAI